MARDIASLGTYVRFYLAVATQLESAWGAIRKAHEVIRDELVPFKEGLAPMNDPLFNDCVDDVPPLPAELTALWKPVDAANLSDLVDVYEVVGRFSFQGTENANLQRVQALVSMARNEILALRDRVKTLASLPKRADEAAKRLATEEAGAADKKQQQRKAAFLPLAQELGLRARQTLDAVKRVEVPNLDDVETAAEVYNAYVQKTDQVYKTCLPFLQKALTTLYTFVGCTVPQSWPESLPLVAQLPSELLSVPPADSPALLSAKGGLDALDQEDIALRHALNEVAANVERIEREIAALQGQDEEVQREGMVAMAMLDYASLVEQRDQAVSLTQGFERQKSERTRGLSELLRRQEQVKGSMQALEEELKERARKIAGEEEELGALVEREPVLFGKDEWRLKKAAFEEDIKAQRMAYAQRAAVLNQLKMDLSVLGVQVQTEQAQLAQIDRWTADATAKRAQLTEQARKSEGELGARRPPRPPSGNEAQAGVAALQARRAEVAERVERLRAEIRRQKDEELRVQNRQKQIADERQRTKAMVESASVQAKHGREAALKQLAAQRRTAVQQHLNEVLGGLEKSLLSIDPVFVTPAWEALQRADAPTEHVSERVEKSGRDVAPVVESIARQLEPELVAQDGMLGKIQQDFCDAAPTACRAAWG